MMTHTHRWITICPLLAAMTLTACQQERVDSPQQVATKNYSRPLPEGQMALRKVENPHALTCIDRGWTQRDLFLQDACNESITWYDKPSTLQWFPICEVDHDRARASVVAFRDLCRSAPDGPAFRSELLRRFDVYESVGCDDEGTVLFTAYCSPTFRASRTQRTGFESPLYTRPQELVTHPESGEPLGRRRPDGGIDPWPSRAEIERARLLEGSELVWLESPIDSYIAHVNGSAKLRMEDGTTIYVGYAGKTDRPYASLGRELVDRGTLPADGVSLQSIRRAWKKNPEMVENAMHANESFVFFQEYDGGSWPAGSLGFPVTARRSVATDKSVFPRGSIVLADTTAARFSGEDEHFSEFMLDQDTGGAIRAPGRADLYLGAGPMAELLAGRQHAEGKLYYFFLKPEEVAAVNADWQGPGSLAAH
ncbi:MAG: MltA domain-containing protein [Phycisphaerales bacterium]|nr:MltA domain-containing protein [Phycisphaerales bacterium]